MKISTKGQKEKGERERKKKRVEIYYTFHREIDGARLAVEQKLVVIHFITFQKKDGDPGKPIIDTAEINGGTHKAFRADEWNF